MIKCQNCGRPLPETPNVCQCWQHEGPLPSSALVRPSIGDEITFIHRADYTKTTRKRTAKVRHVYEDGKILVYLTFWQNQKGVFVMPEDVLEVRPNKTITHD